jgi:hypothetical protein
VDRPQRLHGAILKGWPDWCIIQGAAFIQLSMRRGILARTGIRALSAFSCIALEILRVRLLHSEGVSGCPVWKGNEHHA